MRRLSQLRRKNARKETVLSENFRIVHINFYFRGTRLRLRDVVNLAVVCEDDLRDLADHAYLWKEQVPVIVDHLSSSTFDDDVSGLALELPREAVGS